MRGKTQNAKEITAAGEVSDVLYEWWTFAPPHALTHASVHTSAHELLRFLEQAVAHTTYSDWSTDDPKDWRSMVDQGEIDDRPTPLFPRRFAYKRFAYN